MPIDTKEALILAQMQSNMMKSIAKSKSCGHSKIDKDDELFFRIFGVFVFLVILIAIVACILIIATR